MTTRIRTMHRQGPVASRRASSPPNTPNEGITHPAGYPDPGVDDYNIGGPSEFGEDVHPPPYRTSGPPHLPEDDGGYRHPAAQPGAPMKNAAAIRKWAYHRASLCTKLASHFVGAEITAAADAGDSRAIDMIERQANIFMDLDDNQLRESMINYKSAALPVHKLARALLANEGEDEGEGEDEETPSQKEAALLRAVKAAYRLRKAAEEDEDSEETEDEDSEEMTEDEDSEETETASKKAALNSRLRRDIKLARRLIAEAKAEEDKVEEAKKEVEEAKKEAARRAKASSKKHATSRRRASEEAKEEEKTVAEAKETEADLEKTANRLRRIAKTTTNASSVRRAAGERLAEVMMALDEIKSKISEMEVGGRYSEDMSPEDDVDALLAEMEAEEAAGQHTSSEMDDDALLAEMMADEGITSEMDDDALLAEMMAAEDAAPETAPEGEAVACGDDMMVDEAASMADDMSYFDDTGFDIGMDPVEDPLADISDMEDPMLASIFASSPSMAVPGQQPVDLSSGGKKANMTRAASARPAAPPLRPQVKKSPVGVGKVGTQVRTASANVDEELSKLWASPPDINGFFR